MTEKSEKRLLIEQKQKDLKAASLNNKILQFDIKMLELEEELDRLQMEKENCLAAIDDIMNT